MLGATISILFGNLIGLFLGYFFIKMSAHNRLNAIENAKQFIGPFFGRWLGFFILVDMIGWIAVGLFDGQKYLQNYEFFSRFSAAPIIGAIGSLFLLPGIKGLKKISISMIFPLIIFSILIVFSIALPNRGSVLSTTIEPHFFRFSGVSIVLAASIGAIIDYPTFFRHSQSKRDSIVSLIMVFIFTSLIQMAGVYLFSAFSDESGKNIVSLLSGNSLITFVFILFIIISMTTTTTWNAYAASVGWESLFPIYKDRTEYAVIGLVATVILGTPEIEQFIISTTMLFNAIVSAVGGVIIFQFLNTKGKLISIKHIKNYQNIFWNNICWFFAAVIGILSFFDVFISRSNSTIISLVSGFLVSALTTQIRQIHGWLINR